MTGAGGLVGAAVARSARGAGLTVLAHDGRGDGDLLDGVQARRVVADAAPDAIVHAAGCTHGDPGALWRDNLLMVVRLLDAVAADAPGARVVLLG